MRRIIMGIVFIFSIWFMVSGALTWAVEEAKPVKETELKGVKIDPAVLKAVEELSGKDLNVALRLYYIAVDGYQAQNQLDKASALLESAVGVFPKQTELLDRLIGLYQQQANYDKVIETAKHLSKLRPENIYYQQVIANAYFSKGNKEAGLTVLQDLAKARADDPNAQIQVAQALQNQGKPEEALKYFEAAVKARPQEAGYMQQLAQAYIANKKWDDAKKIYEKILSMPTSKESWLLRDVQRQLITIAMQQNSLDALIAETQAKLAKAPADLNTHWKLIEAYSMANKPNETTAALERAVKQFPDERELQSRLISNYQMQGNWDKVMGLFKDMIAKNPKDNNIKMQFADAQANAGKFKEAILTLKEVAQAEPDNLYYNERIAEIYTRDNQLDKAIKEYEMLLGRAKDKEEWRKANYTSRIEQLKQQQKQPVQTPGPGPAAGPAVQTPGPALAPEVKKPAPTPAPAAPAPAPKAKKPAKKDKR